jgi:hypothetical protein
METPDILTHFRSMYLQHARSPRCYLFSCYQQGRA